LANHFKTNFALHKYHGYALSDLNEMVPWERKIYIIQVLNNMEEEKNAQNNENNLLA
tara:strand:- start:318 stop:488 length:171 start_codon:yes stop_codon:yes gene_type:complete